MYRRQKQIHQEKEDQSRTLYIKSLSRSHYCGINHGMFDGITMKELHMFCLITVIFQILKISFTKFFFLLHLFFNVYLLFFFFFSFFFKAVWWCHVQIVIINSRISGKKSTFLYKGSSLFKIKTHDMSECNGKYTLTTKWDHVRSHNAWPCNFTYSETCINQTYVYSEHKYWSPRTFGLDRVHCYVHVILYQVLFENILKYLHVWCGDKTNICQKHSHNFKLFTFKSSGN